MWKLLCFERLCKKQERVVCVSAGTLERTALQTKIPSLKSSRTYIFDTQSCSALSEKRILLYELARLGFSRSFLLSPVTHLDVYWHYLHGPEQLTSISEGKIIINSALT